MIIPPRSGDGLIPAAGIFLILLLLGPCAAIRSFPDAVLAGFSEAPEYRNGVDCPAASADPATSCDASLVHVAMTLDSEYLRGSMAAVHSVLRHASCPDHVFFHFIAAEFDSATPRELTRIVRSIFPSLSFKVYIFREDTVINLISGVIYLDSDLVLVDDVAKLWEIELTETGSSGLRNTATRISRNTSLTGSGPTRSITGGTSTVWGGDNVSGSCRELHPGPVSLLHWSGKGKPWVRLDERRPCPLDHLWEPYDLYTWRGKKATIGIRKRVMYEMGVLGFRKVSLNMIPWKSI
ncbi:hypothetical protein SASPL_140289 [Salvia splendens]|uniref:Hexosyltransferase n=1 Tax=Salvia splendens TaxID=180675 RepID=A0A8X8ZBT7_SALSN|nr:hypothetical protein SASPL_140289 [Salvia splendens]